MCHMGERENGPVCVPEKGSVWYTASSSVVLEAAIKQVTGVGIHDQPL